MGKSPEQDAHRLVVNIHDAGSLFGLGPRQQHPNTASPTISASRLLCQPMETTRHRPDKRGQVRDHTSTMLRKGRVMQPLADRRGRGSARVSPVLPVSQTKESRDLPIGHPSKPSYRAVRLRGLGRKCHCCHASPRTHLLSPSGTIGWRDRLDGNYCVPTTLICMLNKRGSLRD